MKAQVRRSRAREFREQLLGGRSFRADGAMGTMLHARGISMESCFDELNLRAPAMVEQVHREYAAAGAEILRTNTFGANSARLSRFGYAEKMSEINRAGVYLAGAAGPDSFVAGAMGPAGKSCGRHHAFLEQAGALCEAGVDLLILETFTDLEELRRAVFEARKAVSAEMVLVAQMALVERVSAEEFAREANAWPVDVIGFNCSEGAAAWDGLRTAALYFHKKFSAFPSAGLPPCLASPEWFANDARRLAKAGVKIIGGCCGTTPEHVHRIDMRPPPSDAI